MTPAFTLQHRNIWLRVDHAIVGASLAEKLRRRTDRERIDSEFRIDIPASTAQKEGERASWQSLNLTL